MVTLNKDIADTNDRSMFAVDITQVQWDDYVKNYLIGLRKFVLKDNLESLPRARTKLNRIYWGTRIFQVCIVAFVAWKVLSFSWLTSVFNLT